MDFTPPYQWEKSEHLFQEDIRRFSLTRAVIFLIGHLFGLSYSAVSKVYQRFSADVKTNKPLSKFLTELRA